MPVCVVCKEEKPISVLHSIGKGRFRCKSCRQRYYQENKERLNAYQTEYARNQRHVWRAKALEALGNKCVACGFSDRRALQIDHINGCADKRERNGFGRLKFFKAIVAGLRNDDVQLLCANCHAIKTWDSGENGHKD